MSKYVVQQGMETRQARRRAGRLDAGADWVADPVPAYGERDLRKYLECGSLAHGFARARCERCGRTFWWRIRANGAGCKRVR